jgi:hypothetical protein
LASTENVYGDKLHCILSHGDFFYFYRNDKR